jgi:hypothetical protein
MESHSSLSPVSYKSTHSSRSSVLERAREYNRRIEGQKQGLIGIQHVSATGTASNNQSSNNNSQYDRRRSKSLERGLLADPYGNNSVYETNSVTTSGNHTTGNNTTSTTNHSAHVRSYSVGRVPQQYDTNRNNDHIDPSIATTTATSPTTYSPTRQRAMASLNNNDSRKLPPPSATSSSQQNNNNHTNNNSRSFSAATPPQTQPPQTNQTPLQDNRKKSHHHSNNNNNSHGTVLTPTTATTTATQSSGRLPMERTQHRSATTHPETSNPNYNTSRFTIDEKKEESQHHRNGPTTHSQAPPSQQQAQAAAGVTATMNGPVVTPELLVDALSGHEDGLLAIAEKLMEHYDSGYDVMGEAIIDAFADVQKLFQHGTLYFCVVFGIMKYLYWLMTTIIFGLVLILFVCITIPLPSYCSGRSGTYGRCGI